MVGETDPELLGVFLAVAEEVGAVETWVRGVEFDCVDSRVAVGGRLLDLRTPGARYPEVFLSLHGAHQGDNAACALAAAEAFFGAPLAPEVVEHALGSVRVPGSDGDRRKGAGGRPRRGAQRGGRPGTGPGPGGRARPRRRHHRLIGMLQGRDPSAMLEALRPAGVTDRGGLHGSVTRGPCRPPPSPRRPGPSGFQALAADTVRDGLTLARARLSSTGTLIVTGSLYVVADAREILVGSTGLGRPR